jgi:hypothetical protein
MYYIFRRLGLSSVTRRFRVSSEADHAENATVFVTSYCDLLYVSLTAIRVKCNCEIVVKDVALDQLRGFREDSCIYDCS